MPKQQPDVQEKKQIRPKQQPESQVAESLAEQTPAEDYLLHGPQGVFGHGTTRNQVARLADPTLTTGDRHFMAGQIGQVQGNLHLQRVMTAARSSQAKNNGSSQNGTKSLARQAEINAETPALPGGEAWGDLFGFGDPSTSLAFDTPPSDEGHNRHQHHLVQREDNANGVGADDANSDQTPDNTNFNLVPTLIPREILEEALREVEATEDSSEAEVPSATEATPAEPPLPDQVEVMAPDGFEFELLPPEARLRLLGELNITATLSAVSLIWQRRQLQLGLSMGYGGSVTGSASYDTDMGPLSAQAGYEPAGEVDDFRLGARPPGLGPDSSTDIGDIFSLDLSLGLPPLPMADKFSESMNDAGQSLPDLPSEDAIDEIGEAGENIGALFERTQPEEPQVNWGVYLRFMYNEQLGFAAMGGLGLQFKQDESSTITVNEPNDEYEQEADQVADAVMRMPEPTATRRPLTAAESPNSTNIQAKENGAEGPTVTPEVETNINSMAGGGQPLPDEEREFFESRMGQDFSQVRLHTDGQAAQTSQDLSARAFTVGSDIAFNQGEYQPGTDEGRRLMAHELTHVVQQGGATSQIQRWGPDEDDETEVDTDSTEVSETETDAVPSTGEAATNSAEGGQAEAKTGDPQAEEGQTDTGGGGQTEAGEGDGAGDPDALEEEVGEEVTIEDGDSDLINFELAEHERWAGSFGEMGTTGSDQRAEFILQQAGQGAMSTAGAAFGTSFAMGAIGAGVGQLAGRQLARAAVSRGLVTKGLPGLGPAIGGVMAIAGLATRDWGQTFDTIGRIGEGEGYAGLANDLEGIAEALDLATQIIDIIAGVAGAIMVASVFIPPLAPALPICTSIATYGSLTSTAIGAIVNYVLRPTVPALRALHTFESQGDPAQIEAEGRQLQASSGQLIGALAGAAGGLAGGAVGGAGGRRADTALQNRRAQQTGGSPNVNVATGPGPRIHAEVPEAPTRVDGGDDRPTIPMPALDADDTQPMPIPTFDDAPTQITPRPDFDDAPTQIIPRPDFDDAPTQIIPRPDFDDAPTQITPRPDFDDAPTQIIPRPDDTQPMPIPPAGSDESSLSSPGQPGDAGTSPGSTSNNDSYTRTIDPTPDRARAMEQYHAQVSADPGRESGVWRDGDGNYHVMQGGPTSVAPPEGATLPLECIYHSHPTSADPAQRNLNSQPSQAGGDFGNGLQNQHSQWPAGRRQDSELHFPTYDQAGNHTGYGATQFTYDPTHPLPLQVQTRLPDGTVSQQRYASFADYEQRARVGVSGPAEMTPEQAAQIRTNADRQLQQDVAAANQRVEGLTGSSQPGLWSATIREGGAAGRRAASDEDQSPPPSSQAAHGSAYTTTIPGAEPGETIEIPINPAYPEPPGTMAELEALQEQINIAQTTEEQLNNTEEVMSAQAEQQRDHDTQLGEAQGVAQDLSAGRTAHQSAVDSTTNTNTQQQSTATDTLSTLNQTAEHTTALYTLVGSLRLFQGMAGLFSYLPGSLGRGAEEASNDAGELITTLNRVSESDQVQANVQQGQGQMQANEQRIASVSTAGSETDAELTTGQEQLTQLQEGNVAALAETEAVIENASEEQNEATDSEDESQTAYDELLGQLESWAEEHRQAREDAIRQTAEPLREQGYTVSED